MRLMSSSHTCQEFRSQIRWKFQRPGICWLFRLQKILTFVLVKIYVAADHASLDFSSLSCLFRAKIVGKIVCGGNDESIVVES